MERTELAAILGGEIDRAVFVLKATRPESNDYGTTLNNLRELFWLKMQMEIENPMPLSTIAQPLETESPMEEKAEPVASFQSEPVGEPEPEIVVETVDITYEDLRAAVKEKAASGKPMQPVIEKYVPEGKPVRLSSVPKERYAELMKELYNAG